MDNFKSADEAVRFWMEQANNYKTQFEQLRREFEEFEEGSKTLENELELDLRQKEAHNRDLTACNIKLKHDNEGLRNKLEAQSQNDTRQQAELMQELSGTKKQLDELKRNVRQLEQKNDDLEKGYRVALQSIEDYETKFNGLIERNVILEGELDEKEQLRTTVQRCRDEARDLRHELHVKSKSQDSNRTEVNVQVPPPARVRSNPISIVNDLLRKVGVIENKLAAAACNRKEEQPSKRKVFPVPYDSEPRIFFTPVAAATTLGTPLHAVNNHTAAAMTPFYVDKKEADSLGSRLCCFSAIN